MKVAISLPKDLFDRAEALANQRQKSRSAIYVEALRAYIDAQDDDAITAKLNEVYKEEDFEETSSTATLIRGSVGSYDEW